MTRRLSLRLSLSVVAVWARNQVTNTDRYLATVAPLASNPDIQNAIADQITAQILTHIDIRGLTGQAVDALADRGASPQVAGQLRAFAGPIASGVQSFTRTQVGNVVKSDAFATAWIQANRLAHDELVRALTSEGGGAVRAVLYDTLVRFLRAGLRTVLVVGLVVAVGALLTGQSVTAVRTRQSLAHALGWLGGSAEQAGLRTGPVGTWVHANKTRSASQGAVGPVAAGGDAGREGYPAQPAPRHLLRWGS